MKSNITIIQGDTPTSIEVHQQIFSYEYEGKQIDIKGELYYNKKLQRFEHWHSDNILVVWAYEL